MSGSLFPFPYHFLQSSLKGVCVRRKVWWATLLERHTRIRFLIFFSGGEINEEFVRGLLKKFCNLISCDDTYCSFNFEYYALDSCWPRCGTVNCCQRKLMHPLPVSWRSVSDYCAASAKGKFSLKLPIRIVEMINLFPHIQILYLMMAQVKERM